jgi:hypothetical protein
VHCEESSRYTITSSSLQNSLGIEGSRRNVPMIGKKKERSLHSVMPDVALTRMLSADTVLRGR